jgi:hypothetical protein
LKQRRPLDWSVDVPMADLERVEGLTSICDELRYDVSR